jgi:long-chain acyl-CoA synthetase
MPNLASHVERWAAESPGAAALTVGAETWTYADLDRHRRNLARQLQALGCGAGDRVAVLLPNGFDFVTTYLAILHIGATLVAVNTQLQPAEIEYMLRDCDPSIVLTTASLADRLGPDGHSAGTVLAEDLADVPGADQLPIVDVDADSPAMIIYTSGTSGRPKGAMLSHRNVISNAAAKVQYTGMGVTDKVLVFLPLYHCYGLNAVLNPVFAAGASAVVLPRFDLRSCVAALRECGVTMFFAVPSIFRMLLDAQLDPAVFAGVRYCLSAGAPLPASTWNEWKDRFDIEISQAYGLTETSPFACYNHSTTYRPDSVGRPIRDVQVRVTDTAGQALGPGQTGEIGIRGPNVMLGYWRRPEATAQALADGWFHTGDLGYLDEDGYLYLVDRLSDMIIVNGQNVYPAEVERVLLADPAVDQAIVYGVTHRVLGEIVCASVVSVDGAPVDDARLLEHCRRQLAPYKVPKVITAVAEIPHNPSGKPMRRVLADRLKAQP